uniref:Uncharacterized protein n=1 Tax=Arundo donax TaxID=35708 RepID=A0A0A9D4H3_ARUDO
MQVHACKVSSLFCLLSYEIQCSLIWVLSANTPKAILNKNFIFVK